MYTREEASQLRREFWTTFGQYISPQRSSEGKKVNWLNYKTGLKYVYFRMDADKRTATIAIELTHPDTGIRELFFEQFAEFKNILHTYMGQEWVWDSDYRDDYGKSSARIYTQITGVSVFKKEDWPALISFFKPRMIALDEFWNDVKDGFEALK